MVNNIEYLIKTHKYNIIFGILLNNCHIFALLCLEYQF